MLWDTNIINKDIDAAGDSVTINTITRDYASDEWSDVTRSSSSTSTIAVVQIMSEIDEIVKLGHMQAGDIIFYFKASESGISRNNTITYQNKEYEIYDVIEHKVANTVYAIEARARRV